MIFKFFMLMKHCLINVPQCVDALRVTALTQKDILENTTQHPHSERSFLFSWGFHQIDEYCVNKICPRPAISYLKRRRHIDPEPKYKESDIH